jgi:hypothetical protein
MKRFAYGIGIVALVVAGPAAVAWVPGAWWAPFIAGFVLGAMVGRGRVTIPLGAALGLVAWGTPLLADHERYGLGPAASSLAAIMGFGHQALIPIVLTLSVGTLLGLTGAWLGSAVRGLAIERQPAISL